MKFALVTLAPLCAGAVLAGGLAACTATDQVQSPTASEKTPVALEKTQSPTAAHTAEAPGYLRFHTAVAAVPDRKFRIYWLGREFTDGVLTYRGPSFASVADNDADVLELEYNAKFSGGGGTGIGLGSYSRDGWQRAKGVLLKGSPGTTSTDVAVNGHPAQLVKIPLRAAPINTLILVIDFGDTVVFADTGAANPATPGLPNPNPLIADTNRFLRSCRTCARTRSSAPSRNLRVP